MFIATIFLVCLLGKEIIAPISEVHMMQENSTDWYDYYGEFENFRPQTPDLKHQTSNLRPQTSDFRLQTSSLKPQTSNFRLQTLGLKPYTSSLKVQTSSLRPQTSASDLLRPQPQTSN